LNDNGRPVLEPYAGAFAGAATPFRVGSTSKIKVLETYPFLENAKVEIPIHVNPFDLTPQALAPIVTMIPWAPKQAGIGFQVSINGQQDKFVSTHQLDFSGTTISANVDFEYVTDPSTGSADGIKILGVETTDFLGEIFVCQDPNTGDLLRVRMYTSAG